MYVCHLVFIELKKTVEIEFTEDDIRLLQNAIVLLNRCTPTQRKFSLQACVRGYRRVNTTKLLVRVGARVGRMIELLSFAAAINAELQVTIPWEEYTDQ